MLKDGVKMSRGWRLEERMRRLKGGEGVTPLEAVKGQARRANGCREERFSGVLPDLVPGQRRGGTKEGRVYTQMEPDVAHVTWAVAGMGTVGAGHPTAARKY